MLRLMGKGGSAMNTPCVMGGYDTMTIRTAPHHREADVPIRAQRCPGRILTSANVAEGRVHRYRFSSYPQALVFSIVLKLSRLY